MEVIKVHHYRSFKKLYMIRRFCFYCLFLLNDLFPHPKASMNKIRLNVARGIAVSWNLFHPFNFTEYSVSLIILSKENEDK